MEFLGITPMGHRNSWNSDRVRGLTVSGIYYLIIIIVLPLTIPSSAWIFIMMVPSLFRYHPWSVSTLWTGWWLMNDSYVNSWCMCIFFSHPQMSDTDQQPHLTSHLVAYYKVSMLQSEHWEKRDWFCPDILSKYITILVLQSLLL